MEIKIRIRLKDKKTNEILVMYNSIFDAMNGIAWFEIDRKKWALLSYDQWTGLKDREGKEIYNGDICKRERYVEYYEIVFYKNAWAIKNETDKAVWHQEFCNGARSNELTVIGNVYDNKNLLSALAFKN